MNQAGAFTKSSSSSTPTSPTLNGYARFGKLSSSQFSSSFVKPPHMQDPSYLVHHASKPATAEKVIALNDLEEGIKLTVLSDIERDQRIKSFEDAITDLEKKRKQDHLMFDRFIKKAKEDQSSLEEKYGTKCLELLKLQKEYTQLNDKYVDAQISIDGFKYTENGLNTLLAIKDQEISDLKETVTLFKPSSPPDLNAMMAIMDPPHLDLNSTTPDTNAAIDFNDPEQEHNYFQPRNYVKKQPKPVTNPDTLRALQYMLDNVQTYTRNPFKGTVIDGVRYAFYFGKVRNGSDFALCTNIVLSSEKKVINVSDAKNPVEMLWNQDEAQRAMKRGYGHIYLGTLTGSRAIETNILKVFQVELGVIF